MRTKNFLIASGLLLLGIIIYKLLFGFILPILLFVSLGSILKILIKGSDENTEQSSTEFLQDSSISLSDENVVEVEPMQENKISPPSKNQGIEQKKTFDPSKGSFNINNLS